MNYPIKTLSQLRPILQGFRKAAGLTQAGMASHLGVTQQTYAQLEANPAAVSVDRLFRVLRVLEVDLTLIPRAAGLSKSDATEEDPLPPPVVTPARKTKPPRATATRNAKRAQEAPPATPVRARSSKAKDTTTTRRRRDNATSQPSRGAAKSKGVSKKRENW